MPLAIKDLSVLRRLAAKGDVYARGILYALQDEASAGVVAQATLTDVPAKNATVVHAAVYGDAAGAQDVSTGLTNPTFARNISCTFGAAWDGGNVTIVGTDQFGAAQSEVITANPGNVVYGAKVFKTVTHVTYAGGGVGSHATNTLTVGTGDKLGCTKKLLNSSVTVRIAGVVDATTVDVANSGFTPSAGNLADGAKDYEITMKVAA